jgi:antitoxin MazE
MKTSVVKIGNSSGIILSKSLLKHYSIGDSVELMLEKDSIVIRPVSEIRKGWNQAFKKMRENNEDTLLINDVFEDEIPEEWD